MACQRMRGMHDVVMVPDDLVWRALTCRQGGRSMLWQCVRRQKWSTVIDHAVTEGHLWVDRKPGTVRAEVGASTPPPQRTGPRRYHPPRELWLKSKELRGLADGLATGAAPVAGLRPLLRPPWFVPETMSVQTLLREFRRGNTHMAIVTDEFGGVSGIVTIEDALEEIVGEISDEHDEAFADGIRMLSADACEALAHVRIGVVNDRLGLGLPEEEDFETIGGFVFHQFGRIPQVGERIESHGARLEVLAATRRRIDLVRVERLEPRHGR